MAEEAEEKKEGDAKAEPPKKKSKKLLIIIVAVVVLIAAGAGAFFMMGGKPEEEGEGEQVEEEHAEDEHHTETIELDTFVVNLSENATFLKTTIVLEVNSHLVHGAPEAAAEGGGGHGGGGGSKLPGVLGEKEANIKDRIIKILSSKKAPQLLDPEGKDELKEELADAINQVVELDEELVVNVFFTTFIIQ